MKTLISILLLLSSTAFAGGSVGTMGAAKEMVYSLGNDGEYIKVVFANWNDGKWTLTPGQYSAEYLKDMSFLNAVSESDATRNWVEIAQ